MRWRTRSGSLTCLGAEGVDSCGVDHLEVTSGQSRRRTTGCNSGRGAREGTGVTVLGVPGARPPSPRHASGRRLARPRHLSRPAGRRSGGPARARTVAPGAPELGPSSAELVADARASALGELDYVAAQAYVAALIAGRCLELCPDDPLGAARRLRTTTFFGAFELDRATGLQRGHRLSVVRWGQARQELLLSPAASSSPKRIAKRSAGSRRRFARYCARRPGAAQ